MALFPRFYYPMPPDRLLEVSQRVYVFDCCFSAGFLDKDAYKEYLDGVVVQLQDCYPDASFMVVNFREGDLRSPISDILSHYGMTVMEYPRQYENCPLLPLETICHLLRCSESWLSMKGQLNVLLLHCERGAWPVLAFMLAAFAFMLAGSEWPPLDTPLVVDCVILRSPPMCDAGNGCRPVVRVYGQDPSNKSRRSTKLLFSSSKEENLINKCHEMDHMKLDIHCHVQGDVVLECVHQCDTKEEMMFRVMFNTAFVCSNALLLTRDEVDVMWDAKDQFPMDFEAAVHFLDANAAPSAISTDAESEDENGADDASLKDSYDGEEIFSNVVDWIDRNGEASLLQARTAPPQTVVLEEAPKSDLEVSLARRVQILESEVDVLKEEVHSLKEAGSLASSWVVSGD